MTELTEEEIIGIKKFITAPNHISRFANPVGTIIAYGGEVTKRKIPGGPTIWDDPDYDGVPTGWLLCDGRQLKDDPVEFRDLAQILREHWGTAGFNKFRLPDLRGRFLRGVTDDPNRDPDWQRRYLVDGEDQVTAQGVGSYQDDSLEEHKHLYDKPSFHIPNTTPGSDRVHRNIEYVKNWPKTETGFVHEATASSETRVKNAAVHWLIKI